MYKQKRRQLARGAILVETATGRHGRADILTAFHHAGHLGEPLLGQLAFTGVT